MDLKVQKLEELKAITYALAKDAEEKMIKLNAFIEGAKEQEKVINAKIKEYRTLKEEVEAKEQELKYAQLRILKLANSKSLDAELKDLITKALDIK